MRAIVLHSLKVAVPSLVALTVVVASAADANAASLVKVNQSDWQAGVTGLPTYVNMYIYVPGQVATKPPIVVAPHHCQGTAQSTYSEMSSLVSIADKTGFIMVIPEATGQNCWDAGSDRSLSHGGKGDTGAIVQMVKYTIGKYSADAKRVYSVGGSSGGIMTEALLGVYPDVFMAGVSLMGVPCGCWADSYGDFTGTASMNNKTPQWSKPCADGVVSKTAQAWGDLVRSYFPGYTGHRPRLQHWHGTTDTTLNYNNLAEDVKEWTNLLGLSATPTGTDTPKSGTTRQYWKNACGYTVYETFSLSGVGHNVPFDGNAVAAYFGLDKATTEDPEAAACGSGTGGAGGSGAGGGSAGGAASSGGRNSGGTGTATAGGGNPSGGSGNGSGGSANKGGSANSGGSGNASTGGAVGAGGSGLGGSVASGGSLNGSGGSATSGGAPASGGAAASRGGAANSGGVTSSTGGSAGASGGDSSGCSCTVVGSANGGVTSMGVGAFALALVGLRRRRSGRTR